MVIWSVDQIFRYVELLGDGRFYVMFTFIHEEFITLFYTFFQSMFDDTVGHRMFQFVFYIIYIYIFLGFR